MSERARPDDLAELLATGARGGVVRRDAAPTTAELDALRATGVRVAVLDRPASKAEWLDGLAAGLALPGWFGRNLDALEEVLARPEPPLAGPVAVVWRGPELLAAADPGAANGIRSVLRDAAAERDVAGHGPLVALLVPATPRPAVPRTDTTRTATPPTDATPPHGGSTMTRQASRVPDHVRRLGKIHHIAVVVRDMKPALAFWRDTLGLELETVLPIPSDRVNIAFLPVGEVKVELVEPTDDTTGVARFLESRGEGFHHICFEVANLAEALLRLEIDGMELIDTAPRKGAEGPVAFLHPRSCHGVLVELIEAPGGPAWKSLGY